MDRAKAEARAREVLQDLENSEYANDQVATLTDLILSVQEEASLDCPIDKRDAEVKRVVESMPVNRDMISRSWLLHRLGLDDV
jgi:hypothetical protein